MEHAFQHQISTIIRVLVYQVLFRHFSLLREYVLIILIVGFEGDRCQNNINDCVDVTCPKGKECVDLIDRYECRCPLGFAGDNCSIDIDPCSKQPCKNGASCVDSDDYSYTCVCAPGYRGK